ncbi:hypothetical protein CR51_25260 [Caballeronia megalochromosomata]|nr:hypothetical protein CR51_25260 [Caballeronia megalochromosomata]
MTGLFRSIQESFLDAVRSDYLELAKMAGSEKIYAVALVTDTWIDSVYLGLNTEAAANARMAFYRNKGKTNEEGYRAAVWWAPAEWGYSNDDLTDSKISGINPILRDKGELTHELANEFFEVVLDIFRTLDQEGLFSGNSKERDITLFISISDDERTEAVENHSAKLLNSKNLVEVFLNRYRHA